MTVTEICIFPVKQGTFSQGGKGKADYDKALSIVNAAEGRERLLGGPAVDQADTFVCLVDWENMDLRRDFEKTENYKLFLQLLGQHFIGAPTVFHISHPHGPYHTPSDPSWVTALAIVDTKPNTVDKARQVIEALLGDGAVKGTMYGVGIEDPNRIVMLTPWKTPEEHHAYGNREHLLKFKSDIGTFVESRKIIHALLTPT